MELNLLQLKALSRLAGENKKAMAAFCFGSTTPSSAFDTADRLNDILGDLYLEETESIIDQEETRLALTVDKLFKY